MNIQIPSQQFGLQSPSFSGPGFQQMQMMQMMMSLLMNVMQLFAGGSGGALGQNQPSFGSGCDCGQGHQQTSPLSGGMPGFGDFSGSHGMPGSGNSSLGNSGSYGNAGTPGSGSTNTSRDSYVPQGGNQTGLVGDLGSGSGSDAVRWALQREGISESNNPDAVREISRGAWQPWCADFVSQAYANSPGGSPFGHQSSVQGILNWGRENDRFFDTASAMRNPSALRVGDVAVWKSDGRSHVGLVTGVNPDGTFNTIEGNTSDAVRRRTHSFMGRGLTGFVRPRG